METESEVLLPACVFASMLHMLMTCGRATLLPDWMFFRYMLRPVHSVCELVLAWKARWKSGTLFNKVKLRESSVHNNVHQAEIQHVQFTFVQNMNKFMNDRSLKVFRRNAEVLRTCCDFTDPVTDPHHSIRSRYCSAPLSRNVLRL